MRSAMRYLAVTAGMLAIAGLSTAREARAQESRETGVEATVELAPKNDSGIRGTATIRDADSDHGHVVVVTLEGLAAGKTYPVHIHRGRCATEGPVLAPLESVTASASGRGASTTTVTSDALAGTEGESGAYEREEREENETAGAAGEHPEVFIQAHLPDGTPAACGDVRMKEGKETG